jgi:basic membrane protein A
MTKRGLFLIGFIVFILMGCEGSSISHKVDFYVDEVIYIDDVLVEEGELLNEPTAPEKEGHEFVGWYVDDTFENPYDFSEPVNQDMDLYAQFSPLSYVISFETNGGTDIEDITLVYDSTITEVNTEKEGYEFLGWYMDESLNEPLNLSQMPGRNLTLYAKWEIGTYQLVFLDHNGDILWAEDYLYQADLSELVQPQAPERQGFVFDGWHMEIPNFMPGYDLIIEPTWVSSGVHIALITDGGSIDDQAYNQGAWEGVVAYGDTYDMTYDYYVPSSPNANDMLTAIELAIDDGAMIIVCPGYMHAGPVYEAQTMFPDVSFLLLDTEPFNYDDYEIYTAENTHNILYKEEDAGFLAGYASVMEGYRDLGFVGGYPVPPILRYAYGFIQGAEYAANELNLQAGDIEILIHYSGNFTPSASLENQMNQWFENGTEIVFSVTGGGLGSVVSAAENSETGKIIGVDVNQISFSDAFLTAAVKNLHVTVYDALIAYFDNEGAWPEELAGETAILGAESNNVGLPTDDESWRFDVFTLEDYENIYQEISDGSFVVSNHVEAIPETTLVTVTVVE